MDKKYNLKQNISESLQDFKGLGKIIANDISLMDLKEFENDVSLVGECSSSLIGFVRSNLYETGIRVCYFPNGRVIGKRINVDNYLITK